MRLPFATPVFFLGVLAISGCSAEHAGPELPPGATSADQASSSAQPPSVMANQSTIPSASSTMPSVHPQVLPASSVPPQPVTTASPARGSAKGRATSSSSSPQLESALPNAATHQADVAAEATQNEGAASFENVDMDPSLKGKLGITRVGSDPNSNNLLSVFAGLKNRTSHSLDLEVQTLYKDRMGNDLNTGSWIPLTLKPHEETEYRSTSISPSAVDFLVHIRHASPNEQGTN